jgi:hypothetical protein
LGLRQGSGDKFLCSFVIITNSTARAERFSYTDWKLQEPSGRIREATTMLSDDDLDSGEVASGGTVKGYVCFDDESKRGEKIPRGDYIVLLEPNFLSRERIAWINQIT